MRLLTVTLFLNLNTLLSVILPSTKYQTVLKGNKRNQLSISDMIFDDFNETLKLNSVSKYRYIVQYDIIINKVSDNVERA
jgi:hypothetical protein